MKNWTKISFLEFNNNQRIWKNHNLKRQFKIKLMLQLRPKREMMKKRKKRKKKRKKKKKKLKKKKKNHQLHQLRKQMKGIHIWTLIWIQMNSILVWTIINQKRKKPFQPHFLLKKWLKWSQMEKISWKILPQEWKNTAKNNSGERIHSSKSIMGFEIWTIFII